MFSSEFSGQSLQAKLADSLDICPVEQILHFEEPINSEYLPAGHNIHA